MCEITGKYRWKYQNGHNKNIVTYITFKENLKTLPVETIIQENRLRLHRHIHNDERHVAKDFCKRRK